MLLILTYAAYLVISIAMTIWVAWTLSKRGRIFLIDGFGGKEELADSINHLLVVGFYLMNLGWVSLSLRFGARPDDIPGAIEFLTTKIGIILIVLGAMHFFNMFVIARLRQRALNYARAERMGPMPPAAVPGPPVGAPWPQQPG
ncbi:MAG TPA: hypothetical protein VJR58_02080 [Vineibacter sp.]|nr:hypothetical protein [Vineibacter sp.]